MNQDLYRKFAQAKRQSVAPKGIFVVDKLASELQPNESQAMNTNNIQSTLEGSSNLYQLDTKRTYPNISQNTLPTSSIVPFKQPVLSIAPV